MRAVLEGRRSIAVDDQLITGVLVPGALRAGAKEAVKMTTLVFRHQGWEMVTNAWSVGSNRDDSVALCYGWSGRDFQRTTLRIGISEFLRRIAEGGVVDLRDVSAG
jgi:hypothetical protein